VGDNIELLVTDAAGHSIHRLDTNPDNYRVLDSMSIGPASIKVYQAKEVVNKLLSGKTEFPEIYLDNQKLEHVIYKEIPFDWRLCLDPYPVSPNEMPLKDGENRYPFLAPIARRINFEFEEEKKRAAFVADKLTLAGHSTGGVIMMGLVSLDNVIKEKIEDVFYIDVPFWGSPKAEYLMLSGVEAALNVVANAEKFRQIATNLP
jgi:hypothetical protein